MNCLYYFLLLKVVVTEETVKEAEAIEETVKEAEVTEETVMEVVATEETVMEAVVTEETVMGAVVTVETETEEAGEDIEAEIGTVTKEVKK